VGGEKVGGTDAKLRDIRRVFSRLGLANHMTGHQKMRQKGQKFKRKNSAFLDR
jgi:hypothetical protein